jgi:hypothetical protein
MHMRNWFEGYYSFPGMVFHCYFPLRILVSLVLVAPRWGIWLLGIPPLSLIYILSLSSVSIGLMREVGFIQFFKWFNLLIRWWLDTIYPYLMLAMCWGNRLRRNREGIVRISLGRYVWVVWSGGAYHRVRSIIFGWKWYYRLYGYFVYGGVRIGGPMIGGEGSMNGGWFGGGG